MGDYEFHMSTINGWVFDSHKTITYRSLAHELGVSANYAKMMLFEFAGRHKGQLKSTYFLSGVRKDDQTLLLQVMPEEKLPDAERKLERLISKHIYSVSASVLSDSAQLWAADREVPPLANSTDVDEWTIIHDTCPTNCSQIERRPKLLKKASTAPLVVRSATVPIAPKEPVLEKTSSTSSNGGSDETSKSSASPAAAKAGATKIPAAKKGSIMGMFANAKSSVSKPSPAKTEEPKTPIKLAPTESLPELDKVEAMDIEQSEAKEEPKGANAKKSPAKKSGKSPTAKKTKSPVPSPPKSSKSADITKMLTRKSSNSMDVVTAPTNEKEVEKDGDESNAKNLPIKPVESKMEVSEPVAPSLEDDLLAELEGSEEEEKYVKKTGGKLKRNATTTPMEEDVFDTEEDPFGTESADVEAAMKKQKEDSKLAAKKAAQQARKEAAEAKKKEKAVAKAAVAAESSNGIDVDVSEDGKSPAKRRRRKRESSPGPDDDDEEKPVITEQRRRFDAYFGATTPAASSDADHGNGHNESTTSQSAIYPQRPEISKTRTRKITETETFINEKGYTVTREIEKIVEEEIPEEELKKLREDADIQWQKRIEAEQAKKVAVEKKATAKATATPAAKKSGMITSFFAKKT